MILQADLNRRFSRLDGAVLRTAYEQKMTRRLQQLEARNNSEVVPESVFKFPQSAEEPPLSDEAEEEGVDLFVGLPDFREPADNQSASGYQPDFKLLNPNNITSFDSARSVYLRAVTRIERAKKRFVLDGKL
jgi:hypothetical protein